MCYDFQALKGRKVELEFSGGDITSNGGAALIRQVDRRLGLSDAVARALHDPRRQASCLHKLATMVRQRLHALALGCEDLNDHQTLRHDAGLQTAAASTSPLASPATPCRLEQTANRDDVIGLHKVLFAQFVKAQPRRPRRLILDFDATDVPLHGAQEGRFFHGYYDHYCYLPLYVFCGRHLLVAYLRRSDRDAARHGWAILALLVKALRRQWPGVEIVLRGDSGFCRRRMLRWCERRQVALRGGDRQETAPAGAVRGTARRRRGALGRHRKEAAAVRFDVLRRENLGPRAARDRQGRTLVVRRQPALRGDQPAVWGAPPVRARLLRPRGHGDRIKNQQADMSATRTSCMRMAANQFRIVLSGLAYTLFEGLRRMALGDTDLAHASPDRIRLTLLRIGAVVVRDTQSAASECSACSSGRARYRCGQVAVDPPVGPADHRDEPSREARRPPDEPLDSAGARQGSGRRRGRIAQGLTIRTGRFAAPR